MGVGPYLHEPRSVSGVWPLRILSIQLTNAQSFLLIVRTDRIVTAPFFPLESLYSNVFDGKNGTGSVGYSDVPAHSRIYRQRGQLTVSRRSKPSSRTALMGEQPNPWDLLRPQDATSRHRGAKPCRRYGLLGKISLLSLGYLLADERRPYHEGPPDH
jgi:hypothetical protein